MCSLAVSLELLPMALCTNFAERTLSAKAVKDRPWQPGFKTVQNVKDIMAVCLSALFSVLLVHDEMILS